ncbi:hypothetical protein GWI33_009311 [Rhynchophorus ferrugineus]|uniref:Uncharacterized protein n=1 Tax=Rhynchophorus ferrugineus TaxID=354439 RepID=A0A834IAZ4_RHYFE|nr:hypothetical protein GWI33_009311 [Rhynchophorus ferrugineus]
MSIGANKPKKSARHAEREKEIVEGLKRPEFITFGKVGEEFLRNATGISSTFRKDCLVARDLGQNDGPSSATTTIRMWIQAGWK